MKALTLMLTVILVLAIAGYEMLNRRSQSTGNASIYDKPNIPFRIQESGSRDAQHAAIFIESNVYSKRNLEGLFLWYHQKHIGKPRNLKITVFTDEQRMSLYLDDLKKPWWASNRNTEKKRNRTQLPVELSSRKELFDAICTRQPSEPLLESDAEPSSSGFNLTYWYMPDLNKPNVSKTVVLRGSTWTEGKYNLETKETAGTVGKVFISSYNLYNVEPSGRYYTFIYAVTRENYVQSRIIFNIRQDEAVPPPINQVGFLNEKTVYVYMGWMFSVTTDAGRTWQLWDAEKDLLGWKCCDPKLIREVSISPEGAGTMTINPAPEQLVRFRTSDFGQHWLKEQ